MITKINGVKATKADFNRLKKDITKGIAKIKKTIIYDNVINILVEA